MVKRTTKILLSFFILICIAACGNQNKNANDDSDNKGDNAKVEQENKGWYPSDELSKDSVTFMNLPLMEKKGKFITLLQEKGFEYAGEEGNDAMLKGKCFGKDSYVILVSTQNGLVYKIIIATHGYKDWKSTVTQFDKITNLFTQHFNKKPQVVKKYTPPYSAESQYNFNGLEDGDVDFSADFGIINDETLMIYISNGVEFGTYSIDILMDVVVTEL